MRAVGGLLFLQGCAWVHARYQYYCEHHRHACLPQLDLG